MERKTDTSTGKVTSRTPTATYLVLVIERRLLLVKAPLNYSEGAFTGALVEAPGDLQKRLVAALDPPRPELLNLFLPFMLDATGFRGEGYVMLAIGVPLLVLGAWNIKKSIHRSTEPESHPIMALIRSFGPPANIIPSIESELRAEGGKISLGRLFITQSWLLSPSVFGLAIIRLTDVVWVYKKVTTTYYWFIIPVSKSHGVIIWTRDGKSLEISKRKEQAGGVLAAILHRVPWVLAGYDKELEALWKSSRAVVVQAVDERRRQGPPAPPLDE